MRDIAVTILFFFLVFYTIKRPYIGVCAWLWVALAYPAGWAWGFSTAFRINFTVAILTIISYVIYRSKPKFKINGITILLFALWLLMLASCFVSESSLITLVWIKFNEFSKILLFYFIVILVLEKKLHVDTFIWSIVLSVSSFAGMEAFKFLVSGGGHRIAGFTGHVLGDRNDLAVAINMCIPLIVYLISQTQHKTLKTGLYILLVLNLISVVGTYSRGGFVGLVVIAAYFYWISKRKMLWTVALIVMLPIGIAMAPSEWSERMDSVKTAKQDSSFVGRLWAWKISTKIANSEVLGHGFYSTQDPVAWLSYGRNIENYGPYTPPIPLDMKPKAAHSIYFQVLGDFGYIGLILFLTILLSLYISLKRIQKLALLYEQPWCYKLSSLLQVSIVGYGITGANVSLAYFDLLYAIIGLVFVLEHRVLAKNKAVEFDSNGLRKR